MLLFPLFLLKKRLERNEDFIIAKFKYPAKFVFTEFREFRPLGMQISVFSLLFFKQNFIM